MKSYTLGLYEKAMPNNLSLYEKLKIIDGIGYDFMEISIDETNEKLDRLNMSKEERCKLLNYMKNSGTKINTMCLSAHRKYALGSKDDVVSNKGLKIMEEAISLATDLNIKIIQLAGYDVYYEESTEETRHKFIVNVAKCAKMAAKSGILLGFETMDTPFMDTIKKANNYVEIVNSPYLNIYPDCGNITNAYDGNIEDIKSDIIYGKGRIIAMHLKEVEKGKYRDVSFGDGWVDFKTVIETSLNCGIKTYVTEFWQQDENWLSEIEKVYNKIKCIFKEI